MLTAPLREVIRTEKSSRLSSNAYAIRYLSCGHTSEAKQTPRMCTPKKVRCFRCEAMARGIMKLNTTTTSGEDGR